MEWKNQAIRVPPTFTQIASLGCYDIYPGSAYWPDSESRPTICAPFRISDSLLAEIANPRSYPGNRPIHNYCRNCTTAFCGMCLDRVSKFDEAGKTGKIG